MKVAWQIHNAVVPPKNDYEKLKRRINQTTLGYGTAITSMYFITHGAEEGVSRDARGREFARVHQSSREACRCHRSPSPFQKQLFAPVGTAVLKPCGIMHHSPLILITARRSLDFGIQICPSRSLVRRDSEDDPR